MANTKGSDNPFPSVLFAEHVDPSNPAAGFQRLFVDTDHLLKLRDSAGTVVTYPTTLGGTGTLTTVEEVDASPTDSAVTKLVFPNGTLSITSHVATYTPTAPVVSARAARATRTSGNISMTTSGWKDVDTGLDLTLAASSGEWIEVGLSAFAASEAQNAGLDAATIVSASPVNYVSGSGGGGASYFGVQGWMCSDVGATNVGTSIIYQLVSGDISGGNVVLRLRYRAAGTKTLVAGTNQPLTFWARVLGT